MLDDNPLARRISALLSAMVGNTCGDSGGIFFSFRRSDADSLVKLFIYLFTSCEKRTDRY